MEHAFTVSKQVTHTGISVTTDYRGLSVGSDAFSKAPLEEASRAAMVDAAQQIAAFVGQQQWEGRVVTVDGDDVYG